MCPKLCIFNVAELFNAWKVESRAPCERYQRNGAELQKKKQFLYVLQTLTHIIHHYVTTSCFPPF